MKAQHIQQRNLVVHGSWKWLLTEFALYYGVSDAYTRLRYFPITLGNRLFSLLLAFYCFIIVNCDLL
jgi:hypothetical protein